MPVIFINSDPSVRYTYLELGARTILGIAHHCHLYAPLESEFQRVGYQVYEDLLQPLDIYCQLLGYIRMHIKDELDALLMCLKREYVNELS